MPRQTLKKYIQFLRDRRSTYLRFNKQLFVGELAGFGAGLFVAEVATFAGLENIETSVYSSGADYAGSVTGFLAIYYGDNKSSFASERGFYRLLAVMKNVLKLWPSVIVADIAFIVARPSLHFLSISMGLETGVGATLAHFFAFGVFNLVAMFSRSIADYTRNVKMDAI